MFKSNSALIIFKLILIVLVSTQLIIPSLSAAGIYRFNDPSSDLSLQRYIQAIRELEQENKLDGHLLIAKGDRLLFSAQSKEFDNASQTEPQFMIGSVSKQFFAVALLKVLYDKYPNEEESRRVEYVKRELSQPLSRFLPPHAAIWNGHMPQWAHFVTLQQLLSHTSGLPNYTEIDKYTDMVTSGKRFFELPHSTSEIIQLISNSPLLFAPGTQFSYSNTGYVLISEVIEELAGLPASDYLQQAIFNPLNMTSTFSPHYGQWESLKNQQQLSRLVSEWQYDPKREMKGPYQPECTIDISNAIGSGSIISTTSDLLKWNLALHKQHSILPLSLYALMISPHKEGYGYGIGIELSNHGIILGHQGSIDTYRSFLFYFPKQDLSLIFLSHMNYDDSRLEEEKEAIMAFLGNNMSEEEKEFIAMEELMKKYPDERGFNRLMQLIETNFEVEEVR